MRAGDLLGNYVLRREIGEGGIAAVFIAEHLPTKSEVVLKVLRLELLGQPETVALFLGEPRALQQVEHENTLEVTDVVADGLDRYFATELLRGRTLAEVIRRGPLPLSRAMHIARQVAAVLAHAHDVDVVHRNLKPANVFLVKRDSGPDFVKLLELGAVRMQIQGDKPVPGTVIGTPAYMAPEQLRQSAGDHRVDMYSFGVLLYELSVGQRPFVGEVGDIVRQHLLEPAPRARSLTDVPEALDTLIAQCLEKDPARRPPSMHEVSLVLGALAESLGPPVAGDDGPISWVAVPKNTSGYMTVVADAVAAPPAFEDEEPSFESVTGEVAALRANEITVPNRPARPAPRAVELPPLQGKRAPWPLVIAAAAGSLVTLVLVTVLGRGSPDDVTPPVVPAPVAVPAVPDVPDVPAVPDAPEAVPDVPVPPVEKQVEKQDTYPVGFGSTPPGAQVWIRMDKRIRLLCNTPCTFKLPTGKEVHVELKLDGYKSAQRTLVVDEGVRFDASFRR